MPNATSFCKDSGYQVPTSASDDDDGGKILPDMGIAPDEEKAPRSQSLAGARSVSSRSRTHPALEGGWAWAVVLSGFTLHCLTRGCLFSTGVLFSEWTSYFGKSKRDTALIGSITTGCALMLGPLASRFVEKWGYRVVAMAGGAISTIGFFASYWANGVYYLYLTYGLLAGTGMGVSYLCGVVAVGEYFDERRSMAFGIAAAGAGCGASVMAVLQRLLLQEYGWRGTMIILAGLSGLNQIAFGALLRPLSSSLNWRSKAGRKRLLNHQLDRSLSGDTTPTEVSGSSERETPILAAGSLPSSKRPEIRFNVCSEDREIGNKPDDLAETLYDKLEILKLPSQPRDRTSSDVTPCLKTPLSPSLMLRTKLKQAYCSNSSSPTLLPKHQKTQSHHNSFYPDENISDSSQTIAAFENIPRRRKVRRPKRSLLKLTTGDAMYLSSISIASSRAAVDDMLSLNNLRGSQALDELSDESTEERMSKSSSDECNYHGESDEEHSLITVRNYEQRYPPVLRNPLFLILAMNQFFTALGIMVPFVHLTEKAILMGISESNAAYLVAVIGIGNVIGKVGLGFLCDMKWTDTFIVFVTSQIGLAVSVSMYPLFTSYGTLVFTSFLFGFFYGNYSAIPSLTAEYVGLHNLAQAIGYINFLEGLAGIIGPPLAGAIYDASLSYNAAFAVAAGFLVVSSLVLGLQPYFYKRITGKRSSLEKIFTWSKYEVQAPRLNEFLQKNDIANNIVTHAKDYNSNCLKLDDEETGRIIERNFHA